jgi:hypothetical protein
MRMKTWALVAAFMTASVSASASASAGAPLRVAVDPRVELMCIIFRLAGSPEYNQARLPEYAADVDRHFAAFREHGVVRRARELRRDRGVSYDAVMSMAIHLDSADTVGEAIPFEPRPAGLDERWPIADARRFLADARAFAAESDLATFLAQHEPLYRTSVARAEELLQREARLDWFDGFFGARPGAQFTVVLGLLNGGGNYGPRVVRPDGAEELYCILGVWLTDDVGMPRFDDSVLSTVAHEFCHSYVNPIVDAARSDLRRAGETLFALVEDDMRRQAYGDWSTMMREALVRACVVRYVHGTRGAEAAAAEVREQAARSFHWTGPLADLLAEHERAEPPAPFAAFMPRVVAFFADYAPRFEAEQAALEARRPRIVAMTPAPGAVDVDPALAAITITFDRPMRRGWSIVGGGEDYPEVTGEVSYDASATVLTVPVRLRAGWTYRFWLNRGRYQSFRSADDVSLAPVEVEFRTRPDGEG